MLSQPPLGLVPALEAGRVLASAPYIARMDGDDIASPDRLRLQADYLDERPAVLAVGGQVEFLSTRWATTCGGGPTRPRLAIVAPI